MTRPDGFTLAPPARAGDRKPVMSENGEAGRPRLVDEPAANAGRYSPQGRDQFVDGEAGAGMSLQHPLEHAPAERERAMSAREEAIDLSYGVNIHSWPPLSFQVPIKYFPWNTIVAESHRVDVL